MTLPGDTLTAQLRTVFGTEAAQVCVHTQPTPQGRHAPVNLTVTSSRGRRLPPTPDTLRGRHFTAGGLAIVTTPAGRVGVPIDDPVAYHGTLAEHPEALDSIITELLMDPGTALHEALSAHVAERGDCTFTLPAAPPALTVIDVALRDAGHTVGIRAVAALDDDTCTQLRAARHFLQEAAPGAAVTLPTDALTFPGSAAHDRAFASMDGRPPDALDVPDDAQTAGASWRVTVHSTVLVVGHTASAALHPDPAA